MPEKEGAKRNSFLSRLEKVRWGAFILERDPYDPKSFKVSIGRLMCWIVFAFLSYMWLSGKAIPETMITSFYVLISYNVVKKLPITKGIDLSKNPNKNGESE